MARWRERDAQGGRKIGNFQPSEMLASLAALILLVGLVSAGGWMIARIRSNKSFDLFVGADVTASVHMSSRKQMFGVLDETVAEGLPQGSHVEMWSFDVNAHKFADLVPVRPEDLWATEDQIMALHPTTFGTYPAVAFKEMAREIALDPERPTAILMLTDGEDEDPQTTLVEAKAVAKMGALKAVWFCGVTSRNGFRSALERRLEPILGNRLIVTGRQDAKEGLQRFLQLMSASTPVR